MSEDILIKRNGPVIEVTLNRPDEGNGATDPMAVQLTELLLDPGDAELVLLRGAGTDFCIGRASMGRGGPPAQEEALARRNSSDVIFDCYAAFRRCPIPVVGVIQGRALGFGCALAAVCDVTLASDAASFQVPEMQHSIMPTMVASSLVDRVPVKAMTYLIWSTAVIDAQRALTWGIVSDVFPAASLELGVKKFTDQVLKAPRPAQRAVKEYARVAMDMPVAGAVDFARNLHATINSSSEMRKKH